MLGSKRSSDLGTFLGMLCVLFIALKLTNYIDWSWWFVLAPILAPIVVFLVAASLAGIAKVLLLYLETEQDRKVRKAQEALDAFAKKYGNK